MSNICMSDGLIRPFTYDDAVLILCNVNPERGDVWDIMKREIRQWAMSNIQDAMNELDEHKDEVWAAAFPDEKKELKNHPDFPAEKVESLARDIYDLLLGHGIWQDVSIYFNGKRMSSHNETATEFRYNGEPFIVESKDPRDYFDYVAAEHILSMSFEGSFYEVLNGYAGNWKVEKEFSALLEKYGCYYELGNAWNLTCCPL